VPGVTQTFVGYTQGERPNPTYEEVCSGSTGHTEAVQMYFNPEEVTYGALLDVLLERADPTTLNRQGSDRGTQYRSGIYYHNPEQEKVAKEKMKEVQEALNASTFGRPTAGNEWKIEIKPSGDFWVAEKYHQQYLSKGYYFLSNTAIAYSILLLNKYSIRCFIQNNVNLLCL
jgi:peptide-methionine (S)-S-oxide reductase